MAESWLRSFRRTLDSSSELNRDLYQLQSSVGICSRLGTLKEASSGPL